MLIQLARTELTALAAGFACALAFGCGGEDGPEAPECPPFQCALADSPTCEGDSRVTFVGAGVCVSDGVCEFEQELTLCAFGCEEGSCVDPCDDVSCAPPAPGCEGDELVAVETPGTCTADTGECTFEFVRTDCTENDEICEVLEDGARCAEPPATCSDERRNGDEGDVDCGGSDCEPCNDGARCRRADDCLSSLCVGGNCATPGCRDAVRNGAESDVDCGGPDCPPCDDGEECIDAADCESDVCETTCQEPSCDDTTTNGSETDVDCGGDACGQCENDSNCEVDSDCLSAYCTPDGMCTAPSCDDGAQNGRETDLDCGGVCDPCADGSACQVAFDCLSSICMTEVCSASSCTDGVLNASETDLDCGGPFCPTCDAGSGCEDGSDCASGACAGAICSVATCDDGAQALTETDVDCGGACEPCDSGFRCESGADCRSAICTARECTVPDCTDDVSNGEETDIDCGGPECSGCDIGESCTTNDDCGTRNCVDDVCEAFATCSDGLRNAAETDVDCGGPECRACAGDRRCETGDDCVERVCEANVCVAPSCSDGVLNGSESDVDCGGTCENCDEGELCRNEADCESGFCDVRCALSSCFDGALGGDEISADCGGACGFDSLCEVECDEGVTPVDAVVGGPIRGPISVDSQFTPPPECFSGPTQGESLFRFEAPASGTYQITTGGPGAGPDAGDAMLYAFDNSCDSDAAVLACAASAAGTATLELEFVLGQVVYIVADRVGDAPGLEVSIAISALTPAGCADGIRSRDEEDVDCGGAFCDDCAPSCEAGGFETRASLVDRRLFAGVWAMDMNPGFVGSSDQFGGTCGTGTDASPEFAAIFRAPHEGRYGVRVQPPEGTAVLDDVVLYVLDDACAESESELACTQVEGASAELFVDLDLGQWVTIVADFVDGAPTPAKLLVYVADD